MFSLSSSRKCLKRNLRNCLFLPIFIAAILTSPHPLFSDQYISADSYSAPGALLSHTKPDSALEEAEPRYPLKTPWGDSLLAGPLAESEKISSSAFHSISTVKTIHVSPEGSDSFDGSETKPWKSLNAALSNLQPGDTLILQPGIYTEPLHFSESGTASAPITVKGIGDVVLDVSGLDAGAAAVKTDGESFYSLENLLIRNSPTGVRIDRGSQHIAVDGLTTENCDFSLRIIDSINISVKNAYSAGAIEGFSAEGRSRNLTFENVSAYGVSIGQDITEQREVPDRGFVFGASVANVTLRQIISAQHQGAGLDVRAGNVTGDRINAYGNGNNLEARGKHTSISNSIFSAATNQEEGFPGRGVGILAESGFLRLVNVTVVDNKRFGIIMGEQSAVRLENSIIARKEGEDLLSNEGGVLSQDSVIWFSSSFNNHEKLAAGTNQWTNPGFKDWNGKDYGLAANSQAVEFGIGSVSSGALDLEGSQRLYGEAVDAGAFEYHLE